LENLSALKNLKKVLFYLAIVVGVLLITLVTSVFLFKDKIINQFVREANKSLNTPVKLGKIDVSIFQDFPMFSIVLTDVYIEDSHEGLYPLLTAKLVSFQLNPIEVWRGEYSIKGLQINDSDVNLKINNKGQNNFTIIKENEGKETGTIHFALENVGIKNARVHYVDIQANQELTFTSDKLLASIESTNNVYDIKAAGELTTEKIKVEGNSFLAGKSFDVKGDLVLDIEQELFTVRPSTLHLRNSGFDVKGEYRWKDKNMIDFSVDGKDTDIQTLLSLLPEETAKDFEKYRSKGEVYFKARIKGEVSKKKSPNLSIDFGFNDATLFHPDYKSKVEGATLKGSFATSELTNPSKSVLVLKNITGKLNEEPFKANLIIQDFKDPEVLCDFTGRVDAASLLGFYPIENLHDVSGSLLADVSFEGKIQLLKNKATAQRVYTRGSIELENINLKYGSDRIPLNRLKGSLQFNNNDLAMSNVSATMGNSDFLFNGFFKNVITFLLFENQPIGIEADLKSNFLDVDQLFATAFGKPSEGKKQEYEFSISHNINLNFNCDVSSLRYRRFHGTALKGDLLVKNKLAVSRNINLKTMGGDLTFNGIIDAKNNKAIDVVSSFKVADIDIDSVFYVFENFNQDFIEEKHLKGKATADVSLEFVLNQNLKIFPETLIADISIAIKNGQLNSFEPMQKLSKYTDDGEGLSKLRFSDLKNDIHVEKKTIYIPQMVVRNNVTDLKISGTHTFDQQIDYHIITPLRSKKKINVSEAQTALEEDGNGRTKLYLKITGTTDNYRISYDTEAVKKKIGTDLKKEVQELKDAFKNKGKQKEKEAELEKDEYFDW
jgi:hypothetical protein